MKVLQINTLARTNSTGRTVYEMHKSFLEREIESIVVASCISKSEEQYGQYIVGNKWGMRLHALLSRLTGLQGYFSLNTTNKLLEYIEKQAPDIVVIHNIHSNFLMVQKLFQFLKLKEIPTVLVLHDFWFMTGHCVHPIYTGCLKYTNRCEHCDQIKEGNKSWFFDSSLKLWKDRKKVYDDWEKLAVVGVSNWITNCAKTAAIWNKNKYFYSIYNWIDLDRFKILENVKPQKKFTILGVSSEWNEKKGVEDFAKLSWLLEDEILYLIGNIRENVKEQFNLSKVKFITFTDSEEELVEYYNAADVYVSMSKAETFGKTTAEALACGTPCIVYNIAASPELIGKHCGYLADMGDVGAVYDYIKKVKANKKKDYSQFCRKWAYEQFSREKNIEKYIDVFKEMLSIEA